ncbi:phage integrase SAM-like domain-containing protein [Bacteroides thetaiotaomicron]|nr:phage integrase SAM-like domain-containing protein [Bacteroides thetaiotaomicron]
MFDALERYIVEKAPSVSADQIKDYRTLRKHLTAFKEYSSQPVTFRNLNLTFYNEFMDYLFHKVVKPKRNCRAAHQFCRKNHTFVERLC